MSARCDLYVSTIFPPIPLTEVARDALANGHIGYMEGADDIAQLRADLENLEIPDLRARTFLHRLFNKRLARAVSTLADVKIVDPFDRFLTPAGTPHPRFGGPYRGHDHHICRVAAAPVLLEALAEAGLT